MVELVQYSTSLEHARPQRHQARPKPKPARVRSPPPPFHNSGQRASKDVRYMRNTTCVQSWLLGCSPGLERFRATEPQREGKLGT